jgi:hypothetical protein
VMSEHEVGTKAEDKYNENLKMHALEHVDFEFVQMTLVLKPWFF